MKTFRFGRGRRVANGAIGVLIRLGIAPRGYVLLTVAGRTSGEPRTKPLRILAFEGARYLVAPYGVVQWVRNLRAAGTGSLRRGRRVEQIRVAEVDPAAAGPILRAYAREVPITRPYFAATIDDPPSAFAAEAEHHPVFRCLPAG